MRRISGIEHYCIASTTVQKVISKTHWLQQPSGLPRVGIMCPPCLSRTQHISKHEIKYKSLHWNLTCSPLIYALINGLLHGHFCPRNCKIIILNFILWRDFSHSSIGKESACNAGWIPGSGRSSGEGIGYPLQYSWAFLVAQLVKNLHLGSIPGLGRSPGEGKGYPLQYSGLENSMDCVLVHRVAKSRT